jgi:broad specificity phosphatase PhoE
MTIHGMAPNGPSWGYKLIEKDVELSISDFGDWEMETVPYITAQSYSTAYNIAVEQDSSGKYSIVDGYHRLAAALRAGETSVIVNIYKSI